MNGAEISAVAALSGSALGGLTPIIGNYLVQRGLTEREMLERELGARQSLYSDFIQFATKMYVNATTKELEDADDRVALYALISRIRLIASTPVIEAAEEFAANVTKRYGEKATPVSRPARYNIRLGRAHSYLKGNETPVPDYSV